MKFYLWCFIFMFIFLPCISYGQGTANTKKDPYLKDLQNIDSAGAKTPFGLIYYYNYFLSDNNSDHSNSSSDFNDFNSSKNLSLSFYIDNYQLDYFNNPLGHGFSLMFRDAGRDNGSGFKIGFFKCEEWAKPVYTIGYESSGDLSRKISINWYHNYTVGSAFSGFADGFYIDLQCGGILRIPISFFSLSFIGVINFNHFQGIGKVEIKDGYYDYYDSYNTKLDYNSSPLKLMVKISTNLE